MSDFQQSALEYAKIGLKIIPLRPRTKIPILANWPQAATTDKKTIADWWTDYPDANIGCLTGRDSGIFVIDVDRHGDTDGQISLDDLEAQFGKLPDTVEQITGGGGRQIFFRYPAGATITNKTGSGAIAPGLEIKGDGGQVVLPPSIHPQTGRQYEWEASSHPADVEIVEAPEWLINIITAVRPTKKRDKKFERRATDGPAGALLDNCQFIQYCRDNAETLPEPLWLAMISNVARTSDGPKIVHELSKPYPRYTFEETNAKIIHSLDDMHPQSCEYIRSIGFQGCPAGGCGVKNPASFALSPKLREKPKPKPKLQSAAELEQEDIPELDWIIPDIIPAGLTLLVGAPKIGKSWLALAVSLAAAYGGKALGKIKVEKKTVLYLGLEDTKRRLKSRLMMLACGEKLPGNLYPVRTIPRADQGGLEELEQHIIDTGAKLVIIDTFQMFRRNPTKSQNAYAADTEATAEIKALADKHGIGIVLVHHINKSKSGDFVETISGSYGISGSADTILTLKHARMTGEATLNITGRDVDTVEYALRKDKQTNGWTLMGTAEEVLRSYERRDILNVLRQAPEGLTPTQIAEELGKKRSAVQKLLGEMVANNEVFRAARGTYRASPQEQPF